MPTDVVDTVPLEILEGERVRVRLSQPLLASEVHLNGFARYFARGLLHGRLWGFDGTTVDTGRG